MPSASIRSLVNSLSPLSGVSRDDLKVGDVVTLESVNVHTTYAWTMAFKPAGSTATFSGSPVAASPGTFTVDKEGPYLIRLTADLGMGTESTQFVRLRYLTVFGELKLVAAGEGYGGSIPVPVDIGATGWSDQQNYNHQMVLGLLARISTSGRVLYVDPNAGTHMASGRIVVQNPLTAGDTIDINGISLTGVAGPRTSGANDFNAAITTTTALATNIAAAINDPLNGFSTGVQATAYLNVVTLTPVSGLIVTLAATTTPPGGITVGQGYADFSSVQDAIDAAVAAGATIMSPYLVMVRPGLYTEDVDFQPFVHVFGAEGNPSGTANQRAVVLRGAHSVTTSVNSDLVVLGRLSLENITSNTSSTLVKNGLGSVNVYRCDIEQQGLGASQGPAFRLNRGVAFLDYCTVAAHTSLPDDRSAITQPGGNASTLYVRGCIVRGPTGLTLNANLGSSVSAEVYDSRIVASGAAGVGIISDAESLLLEYTNINTVSSIPLQVHPGAAATADPVGVTIRWCFLDGPISFDITNIGGGTTLQVGSSEYTGFTLPGGTPTVMAATTKATSLFYDNTISGMTAENVQDAIDEAYAAAILVRTLDDAYDGGVPNSGSGRTIVADQGSVQIVDAPVTSDPPPADNANGRLEVVAAVKVGALGFPEIDIDPNPYGFGPTVVMGNRVIPPNIPFGAGTAMVMGRSTGTPLFRNYNLRVQTQSSEGGGTIGRLILQGGDGLDNGASTPDASSVFVQAGTAFDPTATPGSVYIAPGRRQGGNPGSIVFVRPAGSTAATLTAAGVCSSPLGVTGDVTFATNMGAVTASLLSTDNLAAVVAKLDALEGISASQSLGIITLTTDHEGPNAEIYFLSADAGIDAALGVFDGQNQVDGTYGSFIAARVTADQEFTLGVGGATGPLVYNADTGKLTVPGLIDPTGLVFEEAGPPGTGATEGAIFVSDGSAGLTLGDLYYQGPSSAIPVALAGGGGGGLITTYVFRPGGVAAGNVYTDFNLLYTAMSSVEGPKVIMFDDSVTSPILIPPQSGGGGFYSFKNVTAYGLQTGPGSTTLPGPIVRFNNDGVNQARCDSFFDFSYNIAWEGNTLAGLPAVVINDVLTHQIYMEHCWVTPGGAAEFFRVNGGGGFPVTGLNIKMRGVSVYSGAVSTFRAFNSGSIYLEMLDGSAIGDTLQTDASSYISVYYDSTVSPFVPQTNCVGGTYDFTPMSANLGDVVTLRESQPGGNSVVLEVTAAEELTIGTTLPMVYNATTGKLTVPGVIDPTAVVFDEATPPSTGSNEGALFVGNGTSPYADNVLYFRPASSGTAFPLSLVDGAQGSILHRLQVDASSVGNILSATAFGFDVTVITNGPADGDTLTIHDGFNAPETFTFRTVPTLAFEVLLNPPDVRTTLTNLVEAINRDSVQSRAAKVIDLTQLHTNAATRGHAVVIVSLIAASVGNPRLYGSFSAGANASARDFSIDQSRYDVDTGWSSVPSIDPGTRKFFGFQFDGFTRYPTGASVVTASSPALLIRKIVTPTNTTVWLSPSDRLVTKQPCRIATTGNITGFTAATPSVVDGVTLTPGDRVFVWQQTTAFQNGIYEVRVVGTGSNGTWVRSSDFKTGGVFSGTRTFVQEGSDNGQTFITVTTTGFITVGSTSLAFVQEAPLVRTDASSTQIIAATAFTSGTIIWSSAVDMRDYSEISVWFNPTALGSNTQVDLFIQWSDDGTTIPFGDDDGIQQSDFLIFQGSTGVFQPKDYVARLTTAGGELVANSGKLLSFPKKGGSMRFGVKGNSATGTFGVRAQRLA